MQPGKCRVPCFSPLPEFSLGRFPCTRAQILHGPFFETPFSDISPTFDHPPRSVSAVIIAFTLKRPSLTPPTPNSTKGRSFNHIPTTQERIRTGGSVRTSDRCQTERSRQPPASCIPPPSVQPSRTQLRRALTVAPRNPTRLKHALETFTPRRRICQPRNHSRRRVSCSDTFRMNLHQCPPSTDRPSQHYPSPYHRVLSTPVLGRH